MVSKSSRAVNVLHKSCIVLSRKKRRAAERRGTREKPAGPTKQVPGCARSGVREQGSGKSHGGMRLAAALNVVAS